MLSGVYVYVYECFINLKDYVYILNKSLLIPLSVGIVSYIQEIKQKDANATAELGSLREEVIKCKKQYTS